MEYNEKKQWKLISIMGFIIATMCLTISIAQYIMFRRYEVIVLNRYVSLIINIVIFAVFSYLLFRPLDFKVYALGFYLYGAGNIMDNGHVLGVICIIVAAVFLFITDFFKKHKALKATLLSIIPAVALIIQYFLYGHIDFLITAMHIIAIIFLSYTVYTLFYPRFKELNEHHTVKFVNPEDCSEQDLRWLQGVLDGKKYIELAQEDGISESRVKSRMLELYKLFGVHSKTDFLAMYHNFIFQFSVNAEKISG